MKNIIVLLGFLSLGVCAQSPNEVAQQYFLDISKNNIYEMGDYYHPEAKTEFRNLMAFIFKAEEGAQKEIVKNFFGSGLRPYELKLMTDTKFLSLFMEFVIGVRKSVDGISIGDTQVVGEIYEGDQYAYVVTRTVGVVATHEMESFDVMRFKKHKDTWKVLLDSKIRKLGIQIESMAGNI